MNNVQNKTTIQYTGKDALEVMDEALNYNRFLFGLIKTCLKNGIENKVLDFGAGSGTFAKMLIDYTIFSPPPHHHHTIISCIEPDEIYCENLKKEGFIAYRDISEIKKGEKYDLIYSFNVLEHIEQDYETLVAIKQKLSQDGKLLLYVPAFQILYSKFDLKLSHKRRYSKKDLCRKIQEAGFKINNVKYADSIGFLCAIIYKIFINSGNIDKKSVKFYDRFLFPLSRFFDKIGFEYLFGKNILLTAQIDNK